MIAPQPTSPISVAVERGRGGRWSSVCAVQRLVIRPGSPAARDLRRELVEGDRRPALGAEARRVGDPLTLARDRPARRARDGLAALEAVQDVRDRGLLVRRHHVDRHVEALGSLLGLHAQRRRVVEARRRALRPGHHEAASGLGLRRPGIGERAPARLERRQARGVPCRDDAVHVHLEAVGDELRRP